MEFIRYIKLFLLILILLNTTLFVSALDYAVYPPLADCYEDTKYLNKIGFSGAHAEFGSSLAKQILRGKHLTSKQMFYARKIILHYAKQLSKIANKEIPELNPIISVAVDDSGKYKVGDTIRIKGISKSYKVVSIT